MRVEYSSNNSGGDWWLDDDQWKALEIAGWTVEWIAENASRFQEADADGRWLGALATRAERDGLSLGDAIEEWERVTRENSADLGCGCCGPPHSFTSYDENGRSVEWYSPEQPHSGDRYR